MSSCRSTEFTKPDTVRIRQILIRVAALATPEERRKAKAQADEVRVRLETGADFAAVAAEHTDDLAAKNRGGSLGLVTRGRLAPAIEKEVFALQPGQITGVLETAFGYSIVKVDEKNDAAPEPFDKVKEKVRELAARKAMQQTTAEVRARAIKEAGVELYPNRPTEESLEAAHLHPAR